MSTAISLSFSSKLSEDLSANSFPPHLPSVTEHERAGDMGAVLTNKYHGGVWKAGPREIIHLGLGGILGEEDKPDVVVEVSPAIGSVAVLDVMPFSVAHLNIDARELTAKMIKQVVGFLSEKLAHREKNIDRLIPSRSELQKRVGLEEAVKTALRKLGIERDAVIDMMKVLRFAEFKTADVLLLSIPERGRATRSYRSGLVAPAAASFVPMVVADIEPYEDGIAGGFQIFGHLEFAGCRESVMELVSVLEEVLFESNYRACPPLEVSTNALKPPPLKTHSDFKREDRSAAIQERLSQRISHEQAKVLEAELRAQGLLL